ncbi:MAG: M48 family metalloprotease [Helicobacteraceae bacterium]|nr:M48 family metalloprotease [Helicobacteraceae bacterium]
MLSTIIAIYTFYILVKLYASIMQIGFINDRKTKKALLMSESKFLIAGNYAVAKEKMSMASTLLEYIAFIVWLDLGIAWLQSSVAFSSQAYETTAIVLGFILISSIISLPFAYYEKFVLDEAFGFNKSTIKLFIKDTFIEAFLTIIIGGIVILGINYIITNSTLWWLWSFLFIFTIIILINMLFPTVRAMFFDKLTPLDDEELNTQITELMTKTGFQSQGVFISDASKRDARLNAYFGGLGKSKRVVLYDTLLEKLSANELLAVLGHELGHFAHGDIYKNIALVGAMLFGMFALFGNIPSSLFLELNITESSASLMILFLLFMSPLGFIMMPIMGLVSRHNEYEADKMSAELISAEYLVTALKKLVTENKSFPLSHPVYMFLYYTHPPVLERLRELGLDVDKE